MPVLFFIGFLLIIGLYFGKLSRFAKLPSIVGFLIFGVIAGPYVLNIFNEEFFSNLSFITDIALGFVAFSIGLELKFSRLKNFGKPLFFTILYQALFTFILVYVGSMILTGNNSISLLLGAIASATAPAGIVAVAKEYKAKGSFTNILYAIVGFDDVFSVIFFGFSLAIVRSILISQMGIHETNILMLIYYPLKEIIISIVLGIIAGNLFYFMTGKLENKSDIFIFLFGFILLLCGVSEHFSLSLILVNMVFGITFINRSTQIFANKVFENVENILPVLFVLFFTIAGGSLNLYYLPYIALLGILYIVARTFGKVTGCYVGGLHFKDDRRIRKYLGMGILSQAGLSIGLALIVVKELQGLGSKIVSENYTTGDFIGNTVLVIITGTSIIFELFGPALTKYSLKRSGEIS